MQLGIPPTADRNRVEKAWVSDFMELAKQPGLLILIFPFLLLIMDLIYSSISGFLG